MRRMFELLLISTVIVLLSACMARPSAPPVAIPDSPMWLVHDPAGLLRNLPRMVGSQSPLPAPSAHALTVWQIAPTSWISVEMDLVALEYVSPPRAARCYALLAAGINDAVLLAEMARARGLDVSDDAAMAGAAERIMSYSHPLRADLVRQRAADARWVGVWRGQATAAGVAAGQLIGQAVAERVIAWAQRDRAEQFTAFSDPMPAPGVWQRTPPHLWSALEPGWGQVQPIALPSAKQMNAVVPPAWDSPAFVAERAAFLGVQQRLSASDRALALRWAAPVGSVTPAGLWLQIARDAIEQNHIAPRQAVALYATLAVTMHDSFIACWFSKYTYMVARPITWMRASEPAWLSLIDTPPFPSYPSGHATVSGAASTVLAHYFPQDAARLHQLAEDAAYSRVVGGIHWPIDGRNGLAQGRTIGNWILATTATVVAR